MLSGFVIIIVLRLLVLPCVFRWLEFLKPVFVLDVGLNSIVFAAKVAMSAI